MPERDPPTPRRGLRVPHTLVLLFGMIVAAWVLTQLLPQGEFSRAENAAGKLIVQAGTYDRLADQQRVSPLVILSSIPKALADSQGIIFFVFIIGGAIAVVRETGAIDSFLGLVLRRFGHKPGMLIAAGMLVFTVGSSTLGMAEEYIPFVPVLLALCIAMQMDAVTAIGILVVGYGIGYGVAAINPFTVVIAQEIAELEPTSGLGYRVALTVPLAAVGIHHVYRYAMRVRGDPSKSLVADVKGTRPTQLGSTADHPAMKPTHVLVLAAAAASIGLLVYGVKTWHWYLDEMTAMFLGVTIVVAVIGRLGADRTAIAFARGASELTLTALLIGFARAIKIVLEEGHVIDTIIDTIATPLRDVGPSVASIGMLVIQSICNFFIPSGSGQAYVTMPIMAPIGDLTGVSRQVSVLAYQFGDGFTNMLVPTNPVLVGILGMARIPYDRWLRFVMPLMIKLWVIAAAALVVAVAIGYE